MKRCAVFAAAVLLLALAGCGKPQAPSAESLRQAAEKAAADYLPTLLNMEAANNPGNRIYRVSGNEIAIAGHGVRVETQIPAATGDSELIGFTLTRRYSFAKTSFTLKNIAYGPVFEKSDRYFCQLRFLYQKQFTLIPEYTGVAVTGVRPPDRLFATPEAKDQYLETYASMLPPDSVEHRRMIDRFPCTETLIESLSVLAAYDPEAKRWQFSADQTELRFDPRINGDRPDPTVYDPAQFMVELHGRQVALKDADHFQMLVAGAISLGGQWRQVTEAKSSSPAPAATTSAVPSSAEQRAAASPVTGAVLKTPPRVTAFAVYQSAASLPIAERVDAFLKVVPDDPTLSARHWHIVFLAIMSELQPPAITEMIPKVEPVLLAWIKNGKDVDARMISTMGRSHPAWRFFCTEAVLAAAAERRKADPNYVSPTPTYARPATAPVETQPVSAVVQLRNPAVTRNPKTEAAKPLAALFPAGEAVPAKQPAEIRQLLQYAEAPELDKELKAALTVTAMLYACRINDEPTVRACRKNSPEAQSIYATLGPACSSCRGTGFRSCPVCRDGTCRGCGGQGWIERTEQEVGGAVKRRYTCTLCNSSGKCGRCEGKGTLDCPSCNGRGHLRNGARVGDALPRAVEKLRSRIAAELAPPSPPPETAR